MSIHSIPVQTLSGDSTTLGAFAGQTLLVVNVASRCGNTPQYTGLEHLQKTYSERGFSVIGVPSNQFAGQEPGTAEEIQTFCSTTYGITFPLLAKADVNGPDRHPLYDLLTAQPDTEGKAGDVEWNFEKFVIAPDGEVVSRFRPATDPESDEVIAAIEAHLP
jgi:glutathione peroxidase